MKMVKKNTYYVKQKVSKGFIEVFKCDSIYVVYVPKDYAIVGGIDK